MTYKTKKHKTQPDTAFNNRRTPLMIIVSAFKNNHQSVVNLLFSSTLTFIFSTTATQGADLYEWEAYGFWGSRAPTPKGACEKFVAEFSNGPDARAEGVTLSSDVLGNCSWSYWSGWNRPNVDIALRRFGSECKSGSAYNNKTASCESTSKNVGSPCEESTAENPLIHSADGACSVLSKLPSQQGRPEQLSCIGNPINLSSGNKYQLETDYRYGDNSPLVFSRTYNSIDGLWVHNFSTSLRISDTVIVLVKNDGGESYFQRQDGTTTPISNILGSLKPDNEKWVYTSDRNEKHVFDSTGRIIEIISPSGYSQGITYNSNHLIVRDSFNRSFSFSEDFQHQPLSLNHENGNIVYTYDQTRRLSSVQITRNGKAHTRSFEYTAAAGPRLLTAIIDERGVKFSTWSYDAMGRATLSEHAGIAGKISLLYNNDGSTTVFNELGKKSVYRFQLINGSKYVTSIEGEPSPNCLASNSSYTYNERGQILAKVDAMGVITTYTYNDRGLETSRTEASGSAQARTIITEWDATRFLPTRVVEPSRTTFYSYDSQGRELSRQTTPH